MLKVRERWTKVFGIPGNTEDILDRALARREPNYWHSYKYKQGTWDGWRHFYFRKWHGFPTGLLPMVVKLLDSLNARYEIADQCQVIPRDQWHPLRLRGIELRDFQRDTVHAALERKRGILFHATNAGKTESACGIIQTLHAPTLWVTHRRSLMHQTAARLLERIPDITVSRYGDGLKEDEGTVVVAVVNSLVRHRDLKGFLKRFRVLVVDECHHLGGSTKTFYKVAMQCDASYRYGLSGSAIQGKAIEDMRLIACLGPVISEVTNRELIDRGISAEPRIVAFGVTEPEGARSLGYEDAYARAVVENRTRNSLVVRRIRELGVQALVIVRLIRHGELLEAMLRDAGVDARFVSGETSSADLSVALEEFRDGAIDTLVSTNIFNEGIDVPAIRHVAIAAGGKSYVEILQRIGRGLRRKEGENVLHVTDFRDLANRYLREHSEVRMAEYERQGFTVEDGG